MFHHKYIWHIITLYSAVHVLECYVKKKSYPKIEDVISLSDKPAHPRIPPHVIARNFSLDIEKLDLNKFRKHQVSYRRQILGHDLFDYNMSQPFNPSNETRRVVSYHGREHQYTSAVAMESFTRMTDVMLQTIYMARHKIKFLESSPHYRKETIAYRIAFLYAKLKSLIKKMYTIYTIMFNNRYQLHDIQNSWLDYYLGYSNNKWKYMRPMLILHHKMAKVHVDFLYVWWVYIRMYEQYAKIRQIPNSTPRTVRTRARPKFPI